MAYRVETTKITYTMDEVYEILAKAALNMPADNVDVAFLTSNGTEVVPDAVEVTFTHEEVKEVKT